MNDDFSFLKENKDKTIAFNYMYLSSIKKEEQKDKKRIVDNKGNKIVESIEQKNPISQQNNQNINLKYYYF